MTDGGAQGKDRPLTESEKEGPQADRGKEPTSNAESRGPRADGREPSSEAELDAKLVAELRRSYNPPPKPPLDTMWQKVEQGRAETSDEEATDADNVLSIVNPDDETVPRRRMVNGPAESEEPPARQVLKKIVDQ